MAFIKKMDWNYASQIGGFSMHYMHRSAYFVFAVMYNDGSYDMLYAGNNYSTKQLMKVKYFMPISRPSM